MQNASLSFPALLQSLSSSDSTEQLVALTELCEVLSLSTEEQLGGFRVSEYVRVLVNLLETGISQDIVLLGARALTNLLEVLPAAAGAIVSGGGVASLCSKLLMIDSIDVAEQALLALSKLAVEQPGELLRDGALAALIQHVVFFPTNVQRTAFVAAAAIVQDIEESLFPLVMKSAPLLLQHLEGNSDEKTVSQIFLFFSRVISQTGSEEHMNLHATGFTEQAFQALKASLTKASLYTNSTVNLIVTSLLGMCQSSPPVSLALLQMEVAPTIAALAIRATGTLLHELLALALELLPEDTSQPPSLQLTEAQSMAASMARTLSEERPYDPSASANHTDFSSMLSARSEVSSLLSRGFNTFSSSGRSLVPLISLSSSLSSEDSAPADFMTASPETSPPPSRVPPSDNSIPFFSLVEGSDSLPSSAVTLHTSDETLGNTDFSNISATLREPKNQLPPISVTNLDLESTASSPVSQTETKTSSPKQPSLLSSFSLSTSSSPVAVTVPLDMRMSPDASPRSHIKLTWLKEHPAIHTSLAQELISMFVRACNATAVASIRHLCVRGVLRIILSAPSLELVLSQVNITQFAANLLQLGMQNSDYPLLAAVITIVDTLVTKLPLREEFVRGGVVDKIRECAHSGKRSIRKIVSPFMSPYSSPGQSFSLSSATTNSVQAQAQACLKHFPEGAHTSTQAETDLRELGKQLKSSTDAGATLSKIKEMLINKGSITAHELVRSDIAKYLVQFLSQSEGGNKTAKITNLQERQRLFCHIFFGLPNLVDFCANDTEIEASILAVSEQVAHNTALVASFKAALEAVEQFVPEIYEDRNLMLDGLGSDPRIELLSQPFKIKLSWKEDESLRRATRSSPYKPKTSTFTSRVVLADALASMRSIETYLLSQDAISALFPSLSGEEKQKKGKDTEEVFIRAVKRAQDYARPIHLGFELEGIKVSQETSVLKAVQLSLQARGEAGGDCKSIWDKTYDVQFFKITTPSAEVTTPPTMWPSPNRLASLAEESLAFSVADQPVYQLLQLLRCCSDLSQQWPLLFSMSAEGLVSGFSQRLVSPSAFVSEKLSKRVQMQIEDPIAVGGGCFPSWCVRLCREYPFMLTLSVRRLYFKLTGFNTSHHLHTLETHLENSDTRMMEGSPRLERDGSRQRVRGNPRHHIQQLKLRVHRSNVLEVACDLMDAYAKRRGFIRAEFLGEEGVGLGPTLELFALVSQKIQQRKLRLWFDQDAEAVVVAEEKTQELAPPPPATIRGSLRSSKKAKRPPPTALSEPPWPSSVSRTSIDRTRAKEFHRLGVCVCRGCRLLEVPQCWRHESLLTQRDNGQWSCSKKRCTTSSKRLPRKCKICDADREMQEWLLSNREADYIKAGFPINSVVYPHIVLRCSRCWCVNFPGSDGILNTNRGGQMVSSAGRVMSEKEYRGSTHHLAARCSNSALEAVPVLIPVDDAKALWTLAPNGTPANEDSSLDFHDDHETTPDVSATLDAALSRAAMTSRSSLPMSSLSASSPSSPSIPLSSASSSSGASSPSSSPPLSPSAPASSPSSHASLSSALSTRTSPSSSSSLLSTPIATRNTLPTTSVSMSPVSTNRSSSPSPSPSSSPTPTPLSFPTRSSPSYPSRSNPSSPSFPRFVSHSPSSLPLPRSTPYSVSLNPFFHSVLDSAETPSRSIPPPSTPPGTDATTSPTTVATSATSTTATQSSSLPSLPLRPMPPPRTSRAMPFSSFSSSPIPSSNTATPSSSSSSSSSLHNYLSMLQSSYSAPSYGLPPTATIRAVSPLPDLPTLASRVRSSSRPHLRLNSTSPLPTQEEPEEYVRCSNGLFPTAFAPDSLEAPPSSSPSTSPAPSPPASPTASSSPATRQRTRVDYFRFLGRLMGQALLEDRLLDLPLAPPFLQLVLGQPLTVSSLLFVNPFVGKSMVLLSRVVARLPAEPVSRRKRPRTSSVKEGAGPDVRLLGCPLADLVLDFTVPGHPEMELKSGGSSCAVTLDNLREYVNLVCSTYLSHPRVQAAVSALRQGLGEIIHLPALQCFSASELQELLCGGDSASTWDFSVPTLKAHVVGRQGYSVDSRALQWLFEILSELTGPQQRAFVRFVTGSPRLPVGGLKSLKPPLSVIRVPCVFVSESSTNLPVTCTLPSAMTCSSYLKLPDYPSKELMKQKLLYSIDECQTGFQLS